MLDFTRAHYLGLRHPSCALGTWDELTTGVPAALMTPAAHDQVALDLARLIGCESGTLGRSTLHLVWDLFGLWSRDRPAFYVDSGSYPILQWGVERAVCRGATARSFPHHDAEALASLLKREAGARRRRIVVTDGWCPRCGRAAPLPDYLEAVRRFGGLLVIDDTQAFGILGRRCRRGAGPYGRGGGGSLRWFGLTGPDIVVINSLAKGFAAPVAVLAASRKIVSRFGAQSDTRVHSSPPSATDVRAAQRALAINADGGHAVRERLGHLVRRFRARLARVGLFAKGSLFPVQSLVGQRDPSALHDRLLAHGVRSVLLRSGSREGAQIAFLVTARHTVNEIDRATETITRAVSHAQVKHSER